MYIIAGYVHYAAQWGRKPREMAKNKIYFKQQQQKKSTPNILCRHKVIKVKTFT